MITAHISNEDLQKSLNDIFKYKRSVREGVKKEILRTAYAVTHKAKKDCPIRTGRLRSSLKVVNDISQDKLQAQSGTNVHYAPYVEFGTGGLVNIPPGLEAYAAQFKGRGLRRVNLRARPFLFPAAESERRNYESNIKKILSGPK